MATRLKTVEFGIPQLNTLTDATLTAMTVITAYIPEFSGTVTIKKAIVEVNFMEGATMTTGNYSSRRIDVSVGGAAATSYTNANLYTGSGENTSVHYAADATSHFQTNWASGTSKTIAVSVLIDSTAVTIAHVNVQAKVVITFEYDDTQTTQIKTVYIPLNCPTGTLATSKPGTANATIPALDTELPEASKTYRNMFIVIEGNVNNTASTTDSTLSHQVDTYTAYTSQTLEMGATSDYWTRFITPTLYYDSTPSVQGIGMDTSASHGFYIWASIARHNHQQAWLVVTYEFDASQSNNCFNSMIIPLKITTIGGGSTTSSDYVRGTAELWVEEPTTITTKQLSAYMYWNQSAAVATAYFRLGTGSFISYTDGAAVLCGGNGCMVRNDSAFTLARGLNTLTLDCYSSDTSDRLYALNGFLIVNYTSGKPTGGYGAANHTVKWNSNKCFDGATSITRTITAFAPSIPETNYFLNGVGCHEKCMSDSTGTPIGRLLAMEKTSGEGNVDWNQVFSTHLQTDAETGLNHYISCALPFIKQYPNDPRSGRLDIETSRRWYAVMNTTGHYMFDLFITYHTITKTVSGTVSGYTGDGSGITVEIHRNDTDEKILSTTTSAGGTYSVTWYDDTVNVYAHARQDATHTGRSNDGTAT